MRFSDELLNQIKSNIDICDVVESNGVNLSRVGRNYKALCPFHSEKSPSFIVYPNTQSFYCFGCQVGGDAITFLMKNNNYEYVEALKYLADMAGVTFSLENNDDVYYKKKTTTLNINKKIARHFFDNLFLETSKHALQYLKNRGLNEAVIKKFGLGFSVNSFDDCVNFLKSQGFSESEIVEADIGVVSRKNGKVYDKFRNRIMFPIIDVKGNVIGFGGRSLTEEDKPKYLNSAKTPCFDKGNNLFCLNFSKDSKENYFILTEGYMDTITLYSYGFFSTVATLGTAITPSQAYLLSKYKDIVYLCYDSDEAGKAATEKAVQIFKDANMEVKTINLMGAKDPDEFIFKYGKTRFKNLLKSSKDSIIFQFEILKNDLFSENFDDKIKYIRNCLKLIIKNDSPLEVDSYINVISQSSGIDRDIIYQEYNAIKKSKNFFDKKKENKIFHRSIIQNNKSSVNKQKDRFLSAAILEETLIACFLKNNELVEFSKDFISIDDIVTDINKKIISIIFKYGEIDFTGLCAFLSIEEASYVSSILAKNDKNHFIKDDIIEIFNNLKIEKINAKINNEKKINEDDFLKYYEDMKNKKLRKGKDF